MYPGESIRRLKRGGRKNAAVQRATRLERLSRVRERESDTYERMDGRERVDGPPTVLTLHECADAGATACVTRPTKSKRETWAQPYWPLSITNGPAAASRLPSNFPLLPPEPSPLPRSPSFPLPSSPSLSSPALFPLPLLSASASERLLPPPPPRLPGRCAAASLPVCVAGGERGDNLADWILLFPFFEQPARFHPIYLNSKRVLD